MAKRLGMLAFATVLALICAVLGSLLDILLTTRLLKTGEVSSGMGVTVGLIFFVALWYGFIRNGRPVWQPGRRFWMRWAWLTGFGYPLVFVESDFFPWVLGLGLANLGYFAFDAFRRYGEYQVTTARKKHG